MLNDGGLHGLRGPQRLLDLLGDRNARLADAADGAVADPLDVLAESEAVLRAPIPTPHSVRRR